MSLPDYTQPGEGEHLPSVTDSTLSFDVKGLRKTMKILSFGAAYGMGPNRAHDLAFEFDSPIENVNQWNDFLFKFFTTTPNIVTMPVASISPKGYSIKSKYHHSRLDPRLIRTITGIRPDYLQVITNGSTPQEARAKMIAYTFMKAASIQKIVSEVIARLNKGLGPALTPPASHPHVVSHTGRVTVSDSTSSFKVPNSYPFDTRT